MLLPSLGLLLASSLAIRIEESSRLPMETALAIAETLAHAVEKQSGSLTTVEDPIWSCQGAACESARGAEAVLHLRLHQGLTQIRLIVERAVPGRSRPAAVAAVDLDPLPAAWGGPIERLARELFPVAAARASLEVHSSELRRPLSPWALVAAGGGVIAAGFGVGFAVAAGSTRHALDGSARPEPEVDRLVGQLGQQDLAAGVLFGAAAALLAVGALILAAN